MFSGAYTGAKVLLTGDTGFKGAWLAYWLQMLGAKVHGLALPPESKDSLFLQAQLDGLIQHEHGDIRDQSIVEAAYRKVQPDIVFHLAAQALVRESYRDPIGTMMTNAMGTAHICDALRRLDKSCAMVVVTSDKCYANNEWVFGYRENDPMGGGDPYSASKGIAELMAYSWRKSFFPTAHLAKHHKVIGTARAGNVIGPGDWSVDRIVPDAIRALSASRPIVLRNPEAVRPWQHVLEPLSGYLVLGAKLLSTDAAKFSEGWNFGPLPNSTRTVRELVEVLIAAWGSGNWELGSETNPPPEAKLLRLAIDKAEAQLGWCPVWNFATTINRTAVGYDLLRKSHGNVAEVRELLAAEISRYVDDARLTHAVWPKG